MQIKLFDRNFTKPKRKHYFKFNSLFLTIALLPIEFLGIINFTIDIDYYLNSEGAYRNYKLSNNSLQELKTIIQLCRDRHIDLKMFISPIHALELEAIRLSGLWSEMETWKKEVVKIIPIWDFSNYNSVNTEAVKDDMQYWFSSSHYSKEIGDSILNILLMDDKKFTPKDLDIVHPK